MKFHHCILLLLVIILIACQNRGGSHPDAIPADLIKTDSINENMRPKPITKIPVTVQQIKTTYSLIHNLQTQGKLDSTISNFNCNGEHSAKVISYTAHGELQAIIIDYQEHDHYSARIEYYFVQNKPFFCFRKENTWRFEDGSAAEGVTREQFKEKRYYIVNGKSVQCLEKNYSYKSDEKPPDVSQVKSKAVSGATLLQEIDNLNKVLNATSNTNINCLALK